MSRKPNARTGGGLMPSSKIGVDGHFARADLHMGKTNLLAGIFEHLFVCVESLLCLAIIVKIPVLHECGLAVITNVSIFYWITIRKGLNKCRT